MKNVTDRPDGQAVRDVPPDPITVNCGIQSFHDK